MDGVKLPGHRQIEKFMESIEKKWGSGQRILAFLKVILSTVELAKP